MAKVTITQHTSGLNMPMPRYLFLGGKMLGLMKGKSVSVELVPGDHVLRIQSAFKWFYKDVPLRAEESQNLLVEYRDREKFWDILFLVDLVFWCIKSLFHLSQPWSLVYDIFSYGYFALWFAYEYIIRKEFFKVNISSAPSRCFDITLALSEEQQKEAELSGHVGTHMDVMDRRVTSGTSLYRGVIFDVSLCKDGEISKDDITLSMVGKGMFVGFFSGIQNSHPYGTDEYHHCHPTLSYELLMELSRRRVSIIGLDFAGVRRGQEHTPTDQMLADTGTLVVENLSGLDAVLDSNVFTDVMVAVTVSATDGATGAPCKVTARVI